MVTQVVDDSHATSFIDDGAEPRGLVVERTVERVVRLVRGEREQDVERDRHRAIVRGVLTS
jgi:hypothetical protein